MPTRTKDQLLALLAERPAAEGLEPQIDGAVWHSIAQKMERLFEIPVFDAPGAFLVGAVFRPSEFGARSGDITASASGKGSTLISALISCLAEAAETVSTHLFGDENILPRASAPIGAMGGAKRSALSELADRSTDDAGWVQCQPLHDDAGIWVPAELCYRDIAPPTQRLGLKIGLGSASGPTLGFATLHGLQELVERDAVALWWLGGRPAREMTLDHAAQEQLNMHMTMARAGKPRRHVLFLDITTDIGIPSVVAATSAPDGTRVALGYAARLSPFDALVAAFFEVLQMETAIHIVEMKIAQQGTQSLSREERMTLKRANGLNLRQLQVSEKTPIGLGSSPLLSATGNDPHMKVARKIAQTAHAKGIECVVLDVTRAEIGVPTVRVISPDLQPMPSTFLSSRLVAQRKRGLISLSETGIDLF